VILALLAAPFLCGLLLAGLYLSGEFLVHADPLERAGVVVLLSGGGTERMDEAARLMRERYAELLLLTDTSREMPDGMLEAQYMRLEAVNKGVSPEQIGLTEPTVQSTRDEANKVREFMQMHQISDCIVVTDPYHTRRTRMIFRDAMQDTDIAVRVVPSVGHWYHAGSWFLSGDGWQTTISEYVKLAYYVISKRVL
jgi:uncharacterized SAM-binding protein YcdF (DUF218 family)